MANFHVMEAEQKHTYQEIVTSLLNHKEVPYFINYIKNNEFKEDELAGLKLFLENNRYEINLLSAFLNPPNLITLETKQTTYANYYKIAAAVMILLAIGYVVKITSTPKSIENYMTIDSGFKVWMSETSKNTDLLNGMSYYKNANYMEAYTHFKKLPNNDTAQYYSAICLIQLKRINEAESYLNKIPKSSVYKKKSSYYLSLCHLSNHNTKKALEELRMVSYTDSLMEEKRKMILIDYKY